MEKEYREAGGGTLLYDKDADWKMKSDFHTKDDPNTVKGKETKQLRWSLDFPPLGLGETGKEYMSSNKNYLEQTEIMIKFLKDFYEEENQEIPKEYQEAIEDFKKNKPTKEEVKSNDEKIWKPAAEKLENLKITKLLRSNPSSVLFDIVSHRIKTKSNHPYLHSSYVNTGARSASGHLVFFGYASSDGVSSLRWGPGNARGDVFAPFSLQL